MAPHGPRSFPLWRIRPNLRSRSTLIKNDFPNMAMANVGKSPNRHAKHNYCWAVVVVPLALKHWATFDSVCIPSKHQCNFGFHWSHIIFQYPCDPQWEGCYVDVLRLWRRHPDVERPRTRRGGSRSLRIGRFQKVSLGTAQVFLFLPLERLSKASSIAKMEMWSSSLVHRMDC